MNKQARNAMREIYAKNKELLVSKQFPWSIYSSIPWLQIMSARYIKLIKVRNQDVMLWRVV